MKAAKPAEDPSQHRCGMVAIVGRPNVGKSTLLNRLLGQKISIVSPKPETTRDRILGILTLPQAQILFLDTPGIYRGAKTLMAQHQIQQAQEALGQADLILLMTEGHAGITEEDRQIISLLPRKEWGQPPSGLPADGLVAGTVPVILAVNKVDRIDRKLLLPQMEEYSKLYPFQEIFPISASKGKNVDLLLKKIVGFLPQRPSLYPEDQITDRPVRLLVQELIREKTLIFTHEEVPHAVAVEIEEWRPGTPSARKDPHAQVQDEPPKNLPPAKQSTYIRATVYLERESQKGILIGKGGGLLKKIGETARKEIETQVGGPVYLDLWVKVAPNWRKDPAMLKRLGYG